LWGRLQLFGAQLKPVSFKQHWDTSTLTLVWQTIKKLVKMESRWGAPAWPDQPGSLARVGGDDV